MTAFFRGGLPTVLSIAEFIFIALENASDVQKLKSMEFTRWLFINEAREVGLLRFKIRVKSVGRFTLDPLTGLGGLHTGRIATHR